MDVHYGHPLVTMPCDFPCALPMDTSIMEIQYGRPLLLARLDFHNGTPAWSHHWTSIMEPEHGVTIGFP